MNQYKKVLKVILKHFWLTDFLSPETRMSKLRMEKQDVPRNQILLRKNKLQKLV